MFALSKTDLQEVIRKRKKEGWDLPEESFHKCYLYRKAFNANYA
jgi:hypothetical protein